MLFLTILYTRRATHRCDWRPLRKQAYGIKYQNWNKIADKFQTTYVNVLLWMNNSVLNHISLKFLLKRLVDNKWT